MKKLKKILIIANPKAGRGQGAKVLREARNGLGTIASEGTTINSAQEMKSTLSQVSVEEYEAVFLVGGDGTINQALPELKKLSSLGLRIGVLPAGTANDLSFELGLGRKWSLIREAIRTRHSKKIDLIEVNQIPFITVGGIGIGSELIEQFNSTRENSRWMKFLHKNFATETYSLLAIKSIFLDQKNYLQRVQLVSDDLQVDFQTPAIFISNQSVLGGKLYASPKSKNDDGQFDVFVFASSHKIDLVKALFEIRSSRSPSQSLKFSASKMSISSLDKEPLAVFGDGELLVKSPELSFKIIPQALNVYSLPY